MEFGWSIGHCEVWKAVSHDVVLDRLWTGSGYQLVMVWFWSLCGALVVRLQSGKRKELDRTTVALLRMQIKYRRSTGGNVQPVGGIASDQACVLSVLRLVLPRRTGGARD